MMHGFGMGWGWGGMVFQILFFGGIILVIIWGIRTFTNQNRQSPFGPANNSSAIDILKKRYAQGEIDKKEFEEKMRDLSQ
ncbi:MAG: SHOCT domain-containing protein [Calditrichaeota bacterium]|nr:SHOCT domain-containing protein [Calditrichota bacterium]